MLHRKVTVALGALAAMALGALACGKSAPEQADTQETPEPSPPDAGVVAAVDTSAPAIEEVAVGLEPVAPPTVTLLDAGVEPRAPLRLKLEAGAAEETTIAMRMGVEMTLDGQKVPGRAMPKARLGLSARVDAVTEAGATWSATITEASLEESPGTSVAMLGQLREGLAAVKGLTASGRISDRGVTTLAGFAGAEPEGPMKTLLEGFRESLVQLAVPLPEEPVGVGARWQVEQVVPQGGMRIRQTTIFDVVSLDGEQVVARVTLTQAAEPGEASAEGLPPGAKLEGFKGTGTGETTLSLGRILPVSSTAKVATAVEMTVPAPDGGGRTMAMAMDIRLALGEAVNDMSAGEPAPEHDAGDVAPDDGASDEASVDDEAVDDAPRDGGGE